MASEEGSVAAPAAKRAKITSSRPRIEGVFEWNLLNFERNFVVRRTNERMAKSEEESPVFTMKASGNSSYAFQMVLLYQSPERDLVDYPDDWAIKLRNVSSRALLVDGNASIEGSDPNGEAALELSPNLRSDTCKLSSLAPNEEMDAASFWGVSLKEIASLKITCTVAIVEEAEHVTEGKEEQEFAQSKTKFKEEMFQKLGRTLGDQKFADVEILCAGETFRCHKVILAAQSTVFRAMFEDNGMAENDGTARVREMEPDILRALLGYVYTGDATEIISADIVTDLFAAADMYNVQALKSLCEDFILHDGGLGKMSPENVCRLIVIADQHKGTKLKTAAIEFVAKNLCKMMKSDNWNEVKGRAALFDEILEKVASFAVIPSTINMDNSASFTL